MLMRFVAIFLFYILWKLFCKLQCVNWNQDISVFHWFIWVNISKLFGWSIMCWSVFQYQRSPVLEIWAHCWVGLFSMANSPKCRYTCNWTTASNPRALRSGVLQWSDPETPSLVVFGSRTLQHPDLARGKGSNLVVEGWKKVAVKKSGFFQLLCQKPD